MSALPDLSFPSAHLLLYRCLYATKWGTKPYLDCADTGTENDVGDTYDSVEKRLDRRL